jgi:hypothetical protein
VVEREKGVSSDRSWVVAEDEKKRENTEIPVYLLKSNFFFKSEFRESIFQYLVV